MSRSNEVPVRGVAFLTGKLCRAALHLTRPVRNTGSRTETRVEREAGSESEWTSQKGPQNQRRSNAFSGCTGTTIEPSMPTSNVGRTARPQKTALWRLSWLPGGASEMSPAKWKRRCHGSTALLARCWQTSAGGCDARRDWNAALPGFGSRQRRHRSTLWFAALRSRNYSMPLCASRSLIERCSSSPSGRNFHIGRSPRSLDAASTPLINASIELLVGFRRRSVATAQREYRKGEGYDRPV